MNRRVALGAGVLLAALVAFALTSGYRSFVGATTAVFALLFLSLVVLVGWAGPVTLMSATLLGVGAFSASALEVHLGVPFLVAVPATLAVTVPLAVVVGLPALRLRGVSFVVVTLAFAGLADQGLFRSDWFAGGGLRSVPVHRAAFLAGDRAYLLFCLVVVGGLFAFTASWRRSRTGRAITAARDDPRAAQAFGVNVRKARLLAFTLSCGYAGVAGALYGGLLGSVSAAGGVLSPFDVTRSTLFVIVAIVGGITSLEGPVIGALLYVALKQAFQGSDLLPWIQLLVFGPGGLYVLLRSPAGVAGLLGR